MPIELKTLDINGMHASCVHDEFGMTMRGKWESSSRAKYGSVFGSSSIYRDPSRCSPPARHDLHHANIGLLPSARLGLSRPAIPRPRSYSAFQWAYTRSGRAVNLRERQIGQQQRMCSRSIHGVPQGKRHPPGVDSRDAAAQRRCGAAAGRQSRGAHPVFRHPNTRNRFTAGRGLRLGKRAAERVRHGPSGRNSPRELLIGA